jgi:hypothetical protein
MDKIKIYLAGSIRDGVAEDFAWRERAIKAIPLSNATILSPLAGKSYNPVAKTWHIYDRHLPDAKYIVQADYWCVDRCDLMLVDLRALADGYPCIGTISEWGRSTARNIMRLVTVSPNQKGANAIFGLHPFIAESAAKVFTDVDLMIDFAATHVRAVTEDPRAIGIMPS